MSCPPTPICFDFSGRINTSPFASTVTSITQPITNISNNTGCDCENGSYTPTVTMIGPNPAVNVVPVPIIVPFKYTRIGNVVNVSGVFVHSSTSAFGPGEYTFSISYPPIVGVNDAAYGHGTWRQGLSSALLPVWIGDGVTTNAAIGYVQIISATDGGVSVSFTYGVV
jgi:hypothetical protein